MNLALVKSCILRGSSTLHSKKIRLISFVHPRLSKNEPSQKINAENFKFSHSRGHPSQNDLTNNMNPGPFGKPPTKRMIYLSKFLRAFLVVGMPCFLYYAFTSDYDLKQEEFLMESLPGYEENMMKSEKYAKRIAELRRERDAKMQTKQ